MDGTLKKSSQIIIFDTEHTFLDVYRCYCYKKIDDPYPTEYNGIKINWIFMSILGMTIAIIYDKIILEYF